MHNLILSGGGVRGLCHLGAIKALEEYNLLKDIKNYAGTSIGSIIAFLLSIGFTYTDLMLIFLNIDVNKFYDVSDIFDFFDKYGLFSYNPTERCIKLLLSMKLPQKNITFTELYKSTNKTLNIVSVNVSTGKESVFNYINTPNVNVIDAIIASCSIPFLFPPKKINGHYYVDAFIVNNFPCSVFCDDMENSIGISIMGGGFDEAYIDTEINSFQDYVLNLFLSFKPCITQNIKPKFNILLNSSCNPINTDITKDEKIELFKNAYIETLEIIKKQLEQSEQQKDKPHEEKTDNQDEVNEEKQDEENKIQDEVKKVDKQDEENKIQDEVKEVDKQDEENKIQDEVKWGEIKIE